MKVQSICVWSMWWELGCIRGRTLGGEARKALKRGRGQSGRVLDAVLRYLGFIL